MCSSSSKHLTYPTRARKLGAYSTHIMLNDPSHALMSGQGPNLVFELPDPHPPPGTSFVSTSTPETIELPARFLLDFQATFQAAKTAQYESYHAMVQQFFDDCKDSWACAACNDIHGYDQEESAVLWYALHEEMCDADENKVENNMLDVWVARANRIEKLYFQEVEGTECLVVKEKPVRTGPKVWDMKKQGCDCHCHDDQYQDDHETGGHARGGHDRGGRSRGGGSRDGRSGHGGRGGTFQRGQRNDSQGRVFHGQSISENHFGQLVSQAPADETDHTLAWDQDHAQDSQADQGVW
ncbi:hypothetical protein DL98DRAFT_618328 [Cadophora sp. DSE1049]|nr:hypothetical protein DL98DRAFT_618328 [Cadophora sp. DSE1049]